MLIFSLILLALIVYWIVKSQKKHKASLQVAPETPRLNPTTDTAIAGVQGESVESIGFDVTITAPSERRDGMDDQSTLAEECWAPKGKEVKVQGRSIPGGLIYVGQGLVACDNRWQVERALIDPTLKATKKGLADKLGYWPSYSEAEPAQRGIYVDWLAGGAMDGSIDQGYLFLYFYGLERRYFYDNSKADKKAILGEVYRLRELFPTYNSFNSYSRKFLETIELTSSSDRLYEESPPAPEESADTVAKVALAQAARDGAKIPADWLLLWAYQIPQIGLRTVGSRCYPELLDLFSSRYREQFGEGLVVPETRTRLRVEYRAASGEFSTYADVGELCDLGEGSDLVETIAPLLGHCIEELDPYCRFIGRNDDGRGSLEAIALLPDALRKAELERIDSPFRTWLEERFEGQDSPIVQGSDLIEEWGDEGIQLTKSGRLRKKDAERLCRVLDMFGVSMVPDVRLGDRTLGKDSVVVLYRSAALDGDLSNTYRVAELVATLLATVAHADGDVDERERERVLAHSREQPDLSPAEVARLSAVCHQLLADPPTFRGLKDLVSEHLGPDESRLVADLCLVTAVADGTLEGAEIKTLKKVYNLLGLDEERIHADLHSLRAGGSTAGESTVAGEALTDGTMVPLDKEKIRLKQEQSKRAADLIGKVMAAGDDEEEEPEESMSDDASMGRTDELGSRFPGLDTTHAKVLLELSSRNQWSIEEFEELVSSHDLMASGAAEVINEWAFDTFDEPVLEIDDVVYVQQEIMKSFTL